MRKHHPLHHHLYCHPNHHHHMQHHHIIYQHSRPWPHNKYLTIYGPLIGRARDTKGALAVPLLLILRRVVIVETVLVIINAAIDYYWCTLIYLMTVL